MRLGEILIEDGAVGIAALAAAIAERAQHASPRLGAVLVRRGAVSPDAIARALARQHGVPAALDRHLASRDPALAAMLPAELALRLTALPLGRTRLGDQYALVVCLRDPRDPIALELIARAIGEPIVPAVASEAALVPAVLATYEHPAPPDDSVDVVFDDSSGPVIDVSGGTPARDPLTGVMTLVGLDEAGVARDPSQLERHPTGPLAAIPPTPLGAAVRNANATATDARPPTLPPAPLARPPTLPPGLMHTSVDDNWRITGEQAAVAPPDEPPPRIARAEVHAQLAAARNRDAIGDAAIAFIAGRYAIAAILIVKDGLALGHRGAGALAAPIDTITVPLAQPSVLQLAHDRAAPFLGVPSDAGAVQDRVLRALGVRPGTELAIAPVVIGTRVVTLLLGHRPWPGVAAEHALAELVDLAAAMAEAYVRVIREAKRA